MNHRMQQLLDREAIRDVLMRYCRGIDRLDRELVDSVYWDDAFDDHGIYKGPGREFGDFVIPLLREHYDATMHTLGQSLIEIEGDSGRSET